MANNFRLGVFDMHNDSPMESVESYSGFYRGFQMSYECMWHVRRLEDLLRHEALASKLILKMLIDRKEENDQLRADAERWRALVNCDRIRVLGAAGFDEPDSAYKHIGLEIWSSYPVEKIPSTLLQSGVDKLTKFVDLIINYNRRSK